MARPSRAGREFSAQRYRSWRRCGLIPSKAGHDVNARHPAIAMRERFGSAAGRWVISDRFVDSSRVYQGTLGRVDPSPSQSGDDGGYHRLQRREGQPGWCETDHQCGETT